MIFSSRELKLPQGDIKSKLATAIGLTSMIYIAQIKKLWIGGYFGWIRTHNLVIKNPAV